MSNKDPSAIRDRARAFSSMHVRQLAAELSSRTTIPQGKLNELCAIWAELDVSNAMPQAERCALEAIVRFVAETRSVATPVVRLLMGIDGIENERTHLAYEGIADFEIRPDRKKAARGLATPYIAEVSWGSKNPKTLEEAELFALSVLDGIARSREELDRRANIEMDSTPKVSQRPRP